MMKKKVVIIHNIMAPYRFPLFAEIAKSEKIDLEVWFLSESAKNRRWRIKEKIDLPFKYKVLPKIELNFFGKDLFTWIFSPTFPWKLLRSNYDVLISAGWLDFACQAGFIISKILRKPYILWSESTANEPSWRRNLASLLVKTIVCHSDACLPTSTRAKKYLVSLGAKEKKNFIGISTIDIDYFKKTSKLTFTQKSQLKKKLEIQNSRLILFVGQLIERKGVKFLLQAYQQAVNKLKNSDWGLLIVGYGPQQEDLKILCKRQKIKDVYFCGHVEIDEMPKMYGLADLFVLPSLEETFGLVINEAMASGLPIITTNNVGSCLDLVNPGENGFVIPAGNVTELSNAIIKIISNPDLLSKMGKKSSEMINKFGPKDQAKSFLQAINYVIKNKY